MTAPTDRPQTAGFAMHRSAWQVFRAPLLAGVIGAAGLAFALFGDGIWDALSWVALSVPVVLALVFGLGALRRRGFARIGVI
jgi:hypothetical protein